MIKKTIALQQERKKKVNNGTRIEKKASGIHLPQLDQKSYLKHDR